jgi:hypothetical protein
MARLIDIVQLTSRRILDRVVAMRQIRWIPWDAYWLFYLTCPIAESPLSGGYVYDHEGD